MFTNRSLPIVASSFLVLIALGGCQQAVSRPQESSLLPKPSTVAQARVFPQREAVSIRAFIEYQHDSTSKQLLQTPRLPSALNQLEISLAPIRRQWEADIAKHYDKFRTATDVQLSNCHRSCAYIANEHFEDLGAGISLEDLPYSLPTGASLIW